MDIRNRRALKEMASARLAEAAYDPRKLALIHTAVSLGAAFLIALINYYLGMQIEGTGGLSGMGMRSMLGTVQTTLQYVVNILLPFWEIGFVYAALQMARGERTGVSDLTEGFRRFGPVLRMLLLQGLIFFGAGIACVYAGSYIFMMTPFAMPLMELTAEMTVSYDSIESLQSAIAEIPLETLTRVMIPFFVIFGILFLAAAAFLVYRFRMANFIIMDQPGTGALQALVGSRRMTRRRRMALLKLDLSFWWFYLLVILAAVLSYGDVLLGLLGVTLPISADAAWFLFYILGMLVHLAVYWYGLGYVQTTFATAYEVLRQQPPEEKPAPRPKPEPKNLPWDTYQES